jgi:hypothetical protein
MIVQLFVEGSWDAMSWLTASETCPTMTPQKQKDCTGYLYLASYFDFFGLYKPFTTTTNKKTADSNHTLWIGFNFVSDNLYLLCSVFNFYYQPYAVIYYPLRTVRPICRTGIPLPSKCCILYIFSTNISTDYFKHAAHCLFFFKMPFISQCYLF